MVHRFLAESDALPETRVSRSSGPRPGPHSRWPRARCLSLGRRTAVGFARARAGRPAVECVALPTRTRGLERTSQRRSRCGVPVGGADDRGIEAVAKYGGSSSGAAGSAAMVCGHDDRMSGHGARQHRHRRVHGRRKVGVWAAARAAPRTLFRGGRRHDRLARRPLDSRDLSAGR